MAPGEQQLGQAGALVLQQAGVARDHAGDQLPAPPPPPPGAHRPEAAAEPVGAGGPLGLQQRGQQSVLLEPGPAGRPNLRPHVLRVSLVSVTFIAAAVAPSLLPALRVDTALRSSSCSGQPWPGGQCGVCGTRQYGCSGHRRPIAPPASTGAGGRLATLSPEKVIIWVKVGAGSLLLLPPAHTATGAFGCKARASNQNSGS
jgi:hypothetical protein